MNTPVLIDYTNEVTNMHLDISERLLFAQVDFLLFDGADNPLRIAVPGNLPNSDHADLSFDLTETEDIGASDIPPALVAVMDFRFGVEQCLV